VASNRVGKELMNTFYGGSFIAGPTGEIRAQVCSSHWQHGHGGFDPRLTLTLLSAMQIGKQTEGDLIDPKPDRHEGVAVYSFDLDDIRGTRARCACCHHAEHASGCMQGQAVTGMTCHAQLGAVPRPAAGPVRATAHPGRQDNREVHYPVRC